MSKAGERVGDILARVRGLSRGSRIAMLSAVLLVVILDQLSKMMVLWYISAEDSIVVVPGFFNLVLAFNRGAAFGLLSDLPAGVRQLTLGVTTVIALGVVFYLLIYDYRDDLLAQVALSMIVGGAFGNIIDRMRYGMVVDFLDVYYQSYHWPAFNLADSAICVGVGILILFRPTKRSV